jgi:replicative DNA helicase
MSKKDNKNLKFLGYNFQLKLLKQFIEDEKFSETIIDSFEPMYFDNEYLRLISAAIKNHYEKYETIPTYETLKQIINTEVTRDIPKESSLALIDEINQLDNKDWEFVQETSIVFVQQQELKKANIKIQKVLEKGETEKFSECETYIKEALEVGQKNDDGIDVFHAVDDVLSDDFRKPVPTGIVGLDNLMDGGLSKGELGVILAPFGVGKTTLVTRMANTAYNLGYNVVQIFFEDNPKVIQRKHYTCWSEVPLNELTDRKDDVKEAIDRFKGKEGYLKLKKMPSDGTTIPHIKQYLRKLAANGEKPDIIFLDYIDCVESTKQYKDDYSAEGPIMRQFETMIAELDVVGWTAIQGNRSSIGANVVEADMIGGSIKKGQIGHFIMSVAKTLDQKEEGRATMAILKSRFGKDGVIFEDILFDNGTLKIDTQDSSDVSFLDFEKNEDSKRSQMVIDALNKKKKLNDEGKV